MHSILKNIKDFLNDKNNQILIVFSLVFFFICYGSIYGDIIYNHDSASWLYDATTLDKGVGFGRFLRAPLEYTLGYNTVAPYLQYWLLYAVFSIAAYFTWQIFKFKRLITKLISTALIMSFPIYAVYISYGNDIWVYACGMMFAVISVYLSVIKQSKWTYLFAAASLAIYQSMISVQTGLLTVYWISTLLQNDVPLKDIILSYVRIIISGLVYVLIFKLLLVATHTPIIEYLNADSLTIKDIIISIPTNIYRSYYLIVHLFAGTSYFFSGGFLYSVLFVLYTIFIVQLFVQISHFKTSHLFKSFILIALLPIMISTDPYVTQVYSYRIFFGYMCGMLLPIVVFEHSNNLRKQIIIAWCLLAIWTNTFQVNTITLLFEQTTELTTDLAVNINDDVAKVSGYDAEDQVILCGNFQDNKNYEPITEYPFIYKDNPLLAGGPNFLLYDQSVHDDGGAEFATPMFKHTGYNVNAKYGNCTKDQPEYPEPGYIVKKNDTYIVNLG